MGVSLNGGTPQNTPKWSFLVGKPMVVGYPLASNITASADARDLCWGQRGPRVFLGISKFWMAERRRGCPTTQGTQRNNVFPSLTSGVFGCETPMGDPWKRAVFVLEGVRKVGDFVGSNNKPYHFWLLGLCFHGDFFTFFGKNIRFCRFTKRIISPKSVWFVCASHSLDQNFFTTSIHLLEKKHAYMQFRHMKYSTNPKGTSHGTWALQITGDECPKLPFKEKDPRGTPAFSAKFLRFYDFLTPTKQAWKRDIEYWFVDTSLLRYMTCPTWKTQKNTNICQGVWKWAVKIAWHKKSPPPFWELKKSHFFWVSSGE